MRLLTSLAAGAGAALLAAPAPAAGLWDHFESAQRENAEYLEQVAAAEGAQQQPAVARASLLPLVSLTDRYVRRDEEDGNSNRNSNGDDDGQMGGSPTRTQSLSLRQSLFNWRDFQLYRAASDASDAATLRARSARSALMVKVAEAYFDGLWTGQQLGLTSTRLRAVREQLSSIASGVEAGTATRLDQLRVQAELQSVIAQEIAARGDHDLALRNLKLVSGLDDEDIEPVGGDAPEEAKAGAEDLRARARDANLSVQALHADLEEAEDNLRAARSTVLPVVEFVGERSRARGGGAERDYDTTGTLELRWTLFAGGGNYPAYQQAVANRRAADVRLRGGIQAVANEAERAINQIRNTESRISALEASVRANEELLGIVTFGYEENVNVLTDVFDAQRDLEDAQSQLSRARYDLLLDSLRLLDVLGALDDERFRDFTREIGG